MYSEAAVDGSDATIWAPADASAALTVDLGSRVRLSDVSVSWTDVSPVSYRIETSVDGSKWSAKTQSTFARYVRVTLTRDTTAGRTGIREIVATTG
jgi:hypothetical protein